MNLQAQVTMLQYRKARYIYRILRSAAAQACAARYRQILSLLYLEVVFSSMSSGITFILSLLLLFLLGRGDWDFLY